ncbi:uncharacterized protein ASCRUDRAFT_76515 [Ascoidea rubescens DSM 1968]|uniref:Uncharacterized protein n=1 Tax=Ascoidea rubescens DSM 1968 TaxID=1344418 RepID=A0A1D2VFV3_9ASCO|nr:hypothetical protein ASCRUDRAFT_76515 [Ascoidea rubescens DSM 1968]ODV60558.1 hypothetical protein ASCRUDRAFT_76515 [Ascoidea rubescens DSM 1968]
MIAGTCESVDDVNGVANVREFNGGSLENALQDPHAAILISIFAARDEKAWFSFKEKCRY